MDEKILRKSFSEIVRGYSEIFFKQKVYVKHFNISDQASVDQIYSENFELAKEHKNLTEKEKLESLILLGEWSQEKERSIELAKKSLDVLAQNKKRAVVPSQLRMLRDQEERDRKDLNAILLERESKLGTTCESFAEKRTNDFYIVSSLYKDKTLENLFFSEEEFDELSDLEVNLLVSTYNNSMNFYNSIKRIALAPFFQNLLSLAPEDAYHFYGIPVVKLTHYQSELLIYGKYFKNLLENNQNIPKEFQEDPDKLIDYVQVKDNFDKTLNKSEGGAIGIPNATAQDLKEMGAEHMVDTTAETLKRSGKKSLSMAELMNLQK